MESRIKSVLDQLDTVLKQDNEPVGDLLNGKAGQVMYLTQRYLTTKKDKYRDVCIDLLDQIIDDSNSRQISNFISLGTSISSPCWLLDSMANQGLLEIEERKGSSDILEHMIEHTALKEFEDNMHDLFYGFIGKSILLIEHDIQKAVPFIDQVNESLSSNAIRDKKHGLYWKSRLPLKANADPIVVINLGIPHGICGIILFQLKCAGLYKRYNGDDSHRLSIDWLLHQLDLTNNSLRYMYLGEESGFGKLGWCYGDQALAYTLLRYHETFVDERAFAKAYELIDLTATKPLNQSGVKFYKKYGFHDLRICHGLSSVAYMYFKMYQVTNNSYLLELAERWFDLTLQDLDIYLSQRDKIIEDQLKKPPTDPAELVDTSMGFLNGLSGVGLALQTYLNPKLSYWDKILLLDRPGHE